MILVPTLAQGAALRQLGILRTDKLPMVAAQWLAGDADSPTLRQLAGEDGSSAWLVEQLWPATLTELSVPPVTDEEAWDVAMVYQLAAWHSGYRSTLELMKDAVRFYVEHDYPAYAPEAGRLYDLDDELDSGWGGSHDEVMAMASEALTLLEARIQERTLTDSETSRHAAIRENGAHEIAAASPARMVCHHILAES